VKEDESALERLRALGYVAGGDAPGKRAYTAEDDPKRLIDLDARMEEVVALYHSGTPPSPPSSGPGSWTPRTPWSWSTPGPST
jgi:hypothetical protein